MPAIKDSRCGFLSRRAGTMWQLGGLQHFQFAEGRCRGVQAVEVRTFAGLQFTILLDRGMDIYLAQYKGTPLCWLSPTGVVDPTYFEPHGLGFLRSCQGGLLFTCGLSYAGAPCVDEGESLGLHGRISHLPAEDVRCSQKWQGDDYLIEVSGIVREVRIHGDHLTLKRTVSTALDSRQIHIHDEVRNEGTRTSPHMMLYHFNLGYPLLDVGVRLAIPALETTGSAGGRVSRETYATITGPASNPPEQVFYHRTIPAADGWVRLALLNPALGLGVQLSYVAAGLPFLVQWLSLADQVYALGLEPANCTTRGRAEDRAAGNLQFIEPGDVRKYQLTVTVLEGAAEVDAAERQIHELVSAP